MTHRLTAYAQIILTVIFLIGYFVTLWDFVHGKVHVPAEWKDTLSSLLSVLTASVLQVMGYWFARQRVSSAAEPKP